MRICVVTLMDCASACGRFNRLFTLLFYLAPTPAALGQLRALTTLTAPTWLEANPYFKEKQSLAQKLSLVNLQTSGDTFHFRFWTEEQALDIWTTNHKSYAGQVTNYAQRYSSKLLRQGQYQVDTVFSNRIALDSSQARQIFQALQILAIAAIPSDDAIPGWNQGLDGTEYLIELTQKGQYSFKTYWTPYLFAASLPEAKKIQTLVDTLYQEYNLASYYQSLPTTSGSYKRNGIPGIQIRTVEEKKTFKHSIWDWF
jgi:hypothetical protein